MQVLKVSVKIFKPLNLIKVISKSFQSPVFFPLNKRAQLRYLFISGSAPDRQKGLVLLNDNV